MARITKARSCTGKVAYRHWLAACEALGNDPEMHPYWCRYCGQVHLGHPRKRDNLLLPTKLFPGVENHEVPELRRGIPQQRGVTNAPRDGAPHGAQAR